MKCKKKLEVISWYNLECNRAKSYGTDPNNSYFVNVVGWKFGNRQIPGITFHFFGTTA